MDGGSIGDDLAHLSIIKFLLSVYGDKTKGPNDLTKKILMILVQLSWAVEHRHFFSAAPAVSPVWPPTVQNQDNWKVLSITGVVAAAVASPSFVALIVVVVLALAAAARVILPFSPPTYSSKHLAGFLFVCLGFKNGLKLHLTITAPGSTL